jgi:tetratricopeptide (TPR) repeat protein
MKKQVVFLVSVVLMCCQPVLAGQIDNLNSAAIKAYRAGDFQQAQKLYLEALEAAKSDPEYSKSIKANLALTYRKLGKENEAKQLEKETGNYSDATKPLSSSTRRAEPPKPAFISTYAASTKLQVSPELRQTAIEFSKKIIMEVVPNRLAAFCSARDKDYQVSATSEAGRKKFVVLGDIFAQNKFGAMVEASFLVEFTVNDNGKAKVEHYEIDWP